MERKENNLPTSISSSFVNTPLLSADETNVKTITLDGRPIINVTYDHTDKNPDYIVSAQALNGLRNEVLNNISDLENIVNNFSITPVISESIISPYFTSNSEWINFNFEFSNGQAIYRNNVSYITEEQATLTLKNDVFNFSGNYFIQVEIDRLDSGTIYIKNNNSDILKEITVKGVYQFDINIENTSAYTLKLTVNNVEPNDIVTINRIYIYHVEQRATQYFNYIGSIFSIGDSSGIASELWVNQQIEKEITKLNSEFDEKLTLIDTIIDLHLRNTNPHGITPSMIGASPKEHGHTPEQCNAAPLNHTHNPIDIGAANIVHIHTPDQCGAASIDHTHTPEQCNAAPLNHTHQFSSILGISEIQNHLNDKNNPHDITKDQIGLDLLQNYSIATIDDCIDRKNDVYLTPNTMGEYLDMIFNEDPSLLHIQYAPKQILNTIVTLAKDESYIVTLRENTIYKIYISVYNYANAKNLSMYYSTIPNEAANFSYYNTWMIGKGGQSGNQMFWNTEATNSFYFLPKDVGNNILIGSLDIETITGTINGNFQTFVGEYTKQNGTNLITNTGYPLRFNGSLNIKEILHDSTGRLNIVFNYDSDRLQTVVNTDLEFSICVFEFVAQDNPLSDKVDDAPLLSRTKYLGNTPPNGWNIEDGSVLEKNLYTQLEGVIKANNVNITQEEYTNQIETSGKCPYFVITDSEIKLPTMPSNDIGSINIIKTHMKIIDENI